MAGSFSADIARFIAHNNGNIDKTVRQTVVLLSQGVVLGTPVDTGRARANWQFGNNFPSGTLGASDRGGGATLTRIAGQMPGVRAGGSVWLVNNLPYISRLENGYSRQAPAGFVRKTLANLPAAIEAYIRGLP